MSVVGAGIAIEPTQHTAAKVAGYLYLFTLATANFAEFYARGSLITFDDAAKTAQDISAHETLFRLGTLSDLVTFAAVVPLLWALYIVLKPINRNLALLAAFWRLAECAIFATIMLNDFATLRLLSGTSYLQSLSTAQLQALARLFLSLQTSGYLIGLVFFGLGSTAFAWVWYQSRYIPRWLSGLGIFSSGLVAIVTLAIMVDPDWADVASPAYFLPSLLFELTLGFWLVFKGIAAPVRT